MGLYLYNTRLRGVVATLCVLAVVVGCGNEKPASPTSGPVEPKPPGKAAPAPTPAQAKPTPTPTPRSVPMMQFDQKGITLKWMDNGKLRMIATATELRGNEVTKQGTLLNVSADLYEDGKLTARITAPTAIADTDKRTVTATGGVLVKSLVRKSTLTAKRVRWFSNKNKIVGDGGVTVNSTVGIVQARAFLADTSLKNLVMKDRIEGFE